MGQTIPLSLIRNRKSTFYFPNLPGFHFSLPFSSFHFLPLSSVQALNMIPKGNVSYAVSGFILKTYANTYKHAEEGQ